MTSWVLLQAKSQARARLVLWSIAALIIVAIVLANTRYVRNFIEGPYVLEAHHLPYAAYVGEIADYFVTCTPDSMFESGLQEVTVTTRHGKETDQNVSARYYFAFLGEQIFMVKSDKNTGSAITGKLVPIPVEVKHQIEDMYELDDLKDAVYPVMLEVCDFRIPGYVGIAGIAIFAGLFGVYVPGNYRTYNDPTQHPAIRRISKWGFLQELASKIESEFKTATVYRSGNLTISDNYVIQTGFLKFNVFRLDDLLWVYVERKRHYYTFIPVGSSYKLKLIFGDGILTNGGSKESHESVLKKLGLAAPWAVFGYSEEVRNNLDRDPAGLRAAVEARKSELRSSKQPSEVKSQETDKADLRQASTGWRCTCGEFNLSSAAECRRCGQRVNRRS
jgi:hypothetical protein